MRTDQTDDDLKAIWAAYAAGRLSDEAAQAAAEAIHNRRANRAGKVETPASGQPCAASRPNRQTRRSMASREKLFGLGRPRPLSREAKHRIDARLDALMVPTEPGRAWGKITPKVREVARVLLWRFHNCRTGLCIPSYATIAAAVHCSTSTVRAAIETLESLGVLSWCNRIKRMVHEGRQRVLRSSNSYWLIDPAPDSSKGERREGTGFQGFFSLLGRPSAAKGPALPGSSRMVWPSVGKAKTPINTLPCVAGTQPSL